MLPPPGQGEEVLGKGGDACKSWDKYLGCVVLKEACTEPTRTTQAPLRRSGSTPIAVWSTEERPQWHKGHACAGLGKEAEYVRAHGFPEF